MESQTHIDNRSQKYRTRSGTTDSGRLYEVKIAALLALRCAGNDTPDMWMASNADEIGDFDDIILFKQTTEDHYTVYMLQLKHQDHPKNIKPSEFTDSTDKKNFKLLKYSKGFVELRHKIENPTDNESEIIECIRKADKIQFVLYTNKGISKCDFLQSSGNNLHFLHTGKSDITESLYTFDSSQLKDYNPEFLKELVLLSNQTHVDGIDELIKSEIKQLISSLSLTDKDVTSISSNFVTFVTKWAQTNSREQYFLTKRDVINKLTDLFLDCYKVDLSKQTQISCEFPHKRYFNEIISDKFVTIVDWDDKVLEFLVLSIADELEKCCGEQIANWCNNLSETSKIFLYLAKQLIKLVGSSQQITFVDVYRCMWLDGKLPLLLEVESSKDYENILHILKLSCFTLPVVLLNKTKQPLLKMSEIPNCFENFEDLHHEYKEELLNQFIKLQGRPSVVLRNLIDPSMFKYLTSNDIVHILIGDFNIGNVYEPPSDHFIERSIYRIFLKPEMLKILERELFLVEKQPELYFNMLRVNKSKICNLHNINSVDLNVCNVICVTENTEDLDLEAMQRKIHEDTGRAVHRLFFHDVGHLEWKMSFGSINNIKTYRVEMSDENDRQFMYTTEKIYELQNTTCLLSANPGMGKSTLMNCLAYRSSNNMWILNINLNQYETYYNNEEWQNSTTRAETHLKYFNDRILEKHNCNIKLSKAVFQKLLDAKQILVLLDGFDEISLSYKNEVTAIAKSLQQEGYPMWVTTRPIMKLHLEEELNTFSTTLKPFTVEDQKMYLEKYFREVTNSKEHQDIIKEFVKQLLEAAAVNLHDRDFEFTGIPLQTKLLADSFFTDCLKAIETNVIELNKNFDLLDLYEKFIKTKLDIVYNKYGLIKNMIMMYKRYQSLCALKLLFDDDFLVKLNIEAELAKFKEVNAEGAQYLQKDGIMVEDDEFVHRTFAEYIAAKWLAENFDSKEDKTKTTVQVLLQVRFDPYYKFLFNIFDRIVSKTCPAHLAVINGQLEEVNKIMRSSTNQAFVEDKLGRSLLHIIAIYGDYSPSQTFYEYLINLNKDVKGNVKNIVEEILNNKEVGIKNDKLQYSPLDYAIVNGSLAIAEKICANLDATNLHINVIIDSELREKYFLYCGIMDYRYLFKTLLSHFAYIDLIEENEPLDRILYSYCTHCCEKYTTVDVEVVEQKLANYLNELGVTIIAELFRFKSTSSDTEKLDYYGNLHIAAAYGSTNNVNFLVCNGSDVNKQDELLNTPLHCAVIFKRLDIVQTLLLQGAKVDEQDENGRTALHWAIENRNADIVSMLLKNNADVNIANTDGETPLEMSLYSDSAIRSLFPQNNIVKNSTLSDVDNISFYKASVDHRIIDVLIDYSNITLQFAAQKGYHNMLSLLVSEGADINGLDSYNKTALHTAVMEDNMFAVKFLISNGANINVQNHSGDTPLHRAVLDDDIEMVKFFILNRADVNVQNNMGNTVLHYATNQNNLEMVKLLVCGLKEPQDLSLDYFLKSAEQRGIQIDTRNTDERSALHFAVLTCNEHIVNWLCIMGGDINAVDSNGDTPLLLAVSEGFSEIAALLLSLGAEVNKSNFRYETPLTIALEESFIDILKLLVSYKANANIHYFVDYYRLNVKQWNIFQEIILLVSESDTQLTAGLSRLLLFQTEEVDVNTSKVLLAPGADINASNIAGDTVLHIIATVENSQETINLLLSAGADVNKQNILKDSPLYNAVTKGHIDYVKLFLSSGADINISGSNENTLLHEAVISDKQEIISLLLSEGAEINKQNCKGNTPLHIAVSSFKERIVALLLSEGADTSITNNDGKTVSDIAVEKNYLSIVSLLS